MSETPVLADPDPKPQLDAPPWSRLDRAARWLALAANVGVVLGLVLMIVQLRQNGELTRTQMEPRKNDFLATHPPERWPRFVTIREDVWKNLPPDVRAKLEVLGECRGWAYADKGRVWTIIIVRKRP